MLKYLKSKKTNQCIKTGYLLTIANKQQCMKKTLIILILTTLGLYTCGQNNKPTEDRVDNKTNTLALTVDNQWIIIECNDGQESGYCGVNPLKMWQKIIEEEKSKM